MSEREPLERHLERAYDEGRIAATWNRIARARAGRGDRPRGWMLAATACAVAAVAIAVVAWVWPRSIAVQPLQSRDPSLSLAPGAVWTARDVVLDDDSTIAIAPGARLQVLTNEGTRFTTLLEAGTARFDVHPGGPRRWEIETGIATVEVVGTAFTVAIDGDRMTVAVTRGVVMVHGERVPNRVARLAAGQQLVVGTPPAPIREPSPTGPPVTPATPPPLPPAPPSPVRTQPPRVADPPRESIAAVVANADRLSSAGDPAGAARLLEGVRGSGDPSSGLASFALGRLYLDVLDKPELAAAAFAEVIERDNPHSLLEDAYARRVEALIRARLQSRASVALADYEHAYPHGRRLAMLHAMMRAP